VSQRKSRVITPTDELSARIERALSQLLYREILLHQKWEEMKHMCKSALDFSCQKAFDAIDQDCIGSLTMKNIQEFLK
jgi:hypothetical protein